MPRYCRAYQVQELRQFAGGNHLNTSDLNDEDICYVWEDLTVSRSCFDDSDPVLTNVTEEWAEFCTKTLLFAVPQDLQKAKPDS